MQPIETLRVASQGDKAQAMGKHFVLDYGSVIMDENGVDGDGGEFGDKDASEGVGD